MKSFRTIWSCSLCKGRRISLRRPQEPKLDTKSNSRSFVRPINNLHHRWKSTKSRRSCQAFWRREGLIWWCHSRPNLTRLRLIFIRILFLMPYSELTWSQIQEYMAVDSPQKEISIIVQVNRTSSCMTLRTLTNGSFSTRSKLKESDGL